jgi:hypothetical protein
MFHDVECGRGAKAWLSSGPRQFCVVVTGLDRVYSLQSFLHLAALLKVPEQVLV